MKLINELTKEKKSSADQSIAFLSLKLGCTLCDKCALCHFDVLGKECSNVHSITKDHPKIPYFDASQRPTELSVSKFLNTNPRTNNEEMNLQ